MQRKSIPQTMAAKMNENHRQNTDYSGLECFLVGLCGRLELYFPYKDKSYDKSIW